MPIRYAAIFTFGAVASDVLTTNGAVFVAGVYAIAWWCWDEYRMWRKTGRLIR